MAETSLDYKVRLEVFEGPLDLLLYLIRKEEIDVWDIPIARITQQYLEYLDLMRELNLDVAGEFILMAATLAHIKSRELLPKNPDADPEVDEEGDPRAELVRRLLEYQKYKNAAEELAVRPLLGRDTFGRGEANVPDAGETRAVEPVEAPLDLSVFALLDAFKRVLARIPAERFHEVEGDTVSVAEKAKWLATEIVRKGSLTFQELFHDVALHRKTDVIATFLALLEMVRMKLLAVSQTDGDGMIRIRSRIPEGTDVMAVILGTDLEKAFAYGIRSGEGAGAPEKSGEGGNRGDGKGEGE